AEDGIRARNVTGVQTVLFRSLRVARPGHGRAGVQAGGLPGRLRGVRAREPGPDRGDPHPAGPALRLEAGGAAGADGEAADPPEEIGRASCRERVEISECNEAL